MWDKRPCKGSSIEQWYTDDPDDEADLVSRYCGVCIQRRRCLEKVLSIETVVGEYSGFAAGLSAAQRSAIVSRGVYRCSCGSVFDPMAFHDGAELWCDECGKGWTVRPLPHDGRDWCDRKSALANTVLGWLVANTKNGDTVPTTTALAKQLGVPRQDMSSVYGALVLDKVLKKDGKMYTRVSDALACRPWGLVPRNIT